MSEIVKHPVILTKDLYISKLILKHVHDLAVVEETIFIYIEKKVLHHPHQYICQKNNLKLCLLQTTEREIA